MNTAPSSNLNEERISVVELLRQIYQSKKIVALFLVAFIALGLLIYSLSPDEHKFKTVLLTENSVSVGQLGSIASLTGMSLGRNDSKQKTLDPLVYEDLIRSSPFLNDIASRTYFFPSIGKEEKLSTYLNRHLEKSFIEKMVGFFSFNFGGKKNKKVAVAVNKDSTEVENENLLSHLVADSEVDGKIFRNEIFAPDNKSAIRILNERITFDVNAQNFLITLSLDLQDKEVGAFVLRDIVDGFIAIAMNYEGEKSNTNLETLNRQIAEKKRDYNAALQRLSGFRDGSINVIKPGAATEGLRLENEVSVAQVMLNSLIQQKESLGIQTDNQRAPISVIEPVQYSTVPYTPSLYFNMIISIFMGLFFGSVFVLVRKSLLIIVK